MPAVCSWKRLGPRQFTRTSAGLLPADPLPPWPACRGRCDRAQAGRDHLASPDQGRELRLGKAGPACQEERDMELRAGRKAARGQKGAAHAYNIKGHRDDERRWVEQAEVLIPASSPAGAARTKEGAHGCRNRGTTIKAAWQGFHLRPYSSARGHPCAGGEYRRSAKKPLSITSVVCGCSCPTVGSVIWIGWQKLAFPSYCAYPAPSRRSRLTRSIG